jgi:hypothetical protein
MTRQFATDQFVGGNQDQVFTKNSGADFDMGWKDPTGGGGGGEGGHKIHTTQENAYQTVIDGTTKYGFSDYNLDDHNAGVTVEVGDYIVSTSGTLPFGNVTGNTYIMTVTGILDEEEDVKFYTISIEDYFTPAILTETGKWTPFNCRGTTSIEDVKVTKTAETFSDGDPSVTRIVGIETVNLRDIPTPGSSDDNYAFNEILKTELWTRLISVHYEGVSDEGGADIGMHIYELYDVAIQAGSGWTRYATEAEAIFTLTTSIIDTLDPDDDEYATIATSVNGEAPSIAHGAPFDVKIPLGKNAYILRHKYENYVDHEESDDSWYLIINNFTYTEGYPSISGSDMTKNTYTGYAKFYLWK